MFRWEICFIWHSCFVFIVQVNTQGLTGINVLWFSVVYTFQNESQVHLWMLTCGAFSFCLHEGKVSLKYDGGATDRRIVKRVKWTQWLVFFAPWDRLLQLIRNNAGRWQSPPHAAPTHRGYNAKSLWYFSADLDADEWGRKEGKKTDGPYYLLQRGEGERRVCWVIHRLALSFPAFSPLHIPPRPSSPCLLCKPPEIKSHFVARCWCLPGQLPKPCLVICVRFACSRSNRHSHKNSLFCHCSWVWLCSGCRVRFSRKVLEVVRQPSKVKWSVHANTALIVHTCISVTISYFLLLEWHKFAPWTSLEVSTYLIT